MKKLAKFIVYLMDFKAYEKQIRHEREFSVARINNLERIVCDLSDLNTDEQKKDLAKITANTIFTMVEKRNSEAFKSLFNKPWK